MLIGTGKGQQQVEQSSDNRCVFVRTYTSIFHINCSFTCTFVLVTLKCITNCLNLTFHTLTYLHFAQKWHFFEISTRVWLTDGRMDGRTDRRMDIPSYRDARTHLKTWISLWITLRIEKEATYWTTCMPLPIQWRACKIRLHCFGLSVRWLVDNTFYLQWNWSTSKFCRMY